MCDNKIEEKGDDSSQSEDEQAMFILPFSRLSDQIKGTGRCRLLSAIIPMADHQVKSERDEVKGEEAMVDKKFESQSIGGDGVDKRKNSAHIKLEIKEELKDANGNNNNNAKTDLGGGGNGNYKKISLTTAVVGGGGGEKGTEKKEKTERTGWKRYIGIILGITSSMLFALTVLIVKVLAEEYHPYSLSFWRFQGVLLPSLPIAFYYRVIKKQPIFDMLCPACDPTNRRTIFFVVLRCLTGASAVVLQFYSLQFINMADSSVIAFSTPVFVSLASHVLLGEKSGFIPVICGIITLFGVVVITRPPILTGGDEFDTNTLIGCFMALGCMFCASSTFLLLRYLRQIHFAVITICFGFWGSFQSLALSATISRFQPPDGLENWMLAIALASLTFLGQTCITLAFKFEQAGTVSLCRTFDILFAYVWQFIFLGVVPDMYSFIGGGIVILGVLIAAFRKFLGDLPPENSTRKRFWIFLK